MITTTFNKAKEAGACRNCYRGMKKALGGIKSYGRNTPIPVMAILDILGMNDALWALAHTCGRKGVKLCHTFACDVAEHVLPAWQKEHPEDNRPAEAIRIKRLWLEGKATSEELEAARQAAWAAWAADAAASAAWAAEAASAAAWAAAWYTRTAARDDERAWQEQHLRELLK